MRKQKADYSIEGEVKNPMRCFQQVLLKKFKENIFFYNFKGQYDVARLHFFQLVFIIRSKSRATSSLYRLTQAVHRIKHIAESAPSGRISMSAWKITTINLEGGTRV
jgi:hypothetical protein